MVVRTSAAGLSLACAVVFGLPLASLVVGALIWQSPVAALTVMLICLPVVYAAMRYASSTGLLAVYADEIESDSSRASL